MDRPFISASKDGSPWDARPSSRSFFLSSIEEAELVLEGVFSKLPLFSCDLPLVISGDVEDTPTFSWSFVLMGTAGMLESILLVGSMLSRARDRKNEMKSDKRSGLLWLLFGWWGEGRVRKERRKKKGKECGKARKG